MSTVRSPMPPPTGITPPGDSTSTVRRRSSPSADTVEALAAWRRLADRDRSVLLLVGWHGAGRAELARILGCTEDAAAMRVSRARRRLSSELAT